MSRAELDTLLLTANTGDETHVVKRGNRVIRVQRVETVLYAVTSDGLNYYVQADPSAVVNLHPSALQRLKNWWFGTRQPVRTLRGGASVQCMK